MKMLIFKVLEVKEGSIRNFKKMFFCSELPVVFSEGDSPQAVGY